MAYTLVEITRLKIRKSDNVIVNWKCVHTERIPLRNTSHHTVKVNQVKPFLTKDPILKCCILMEEDSGANLKDSLQATEGPDRQDRVNYERLRQHMTHSVWHADLQLAEIIKLKGSFFKNMGFVRNGIMYLYPEEVQHLAELQQVYLEVDGQVLDKQALYNLVLQSMPHACYLAYLKLKVYMLYSVLMGRI